MFYIYTLAHPGTGEIRYIGKTNDLKGRLKSHIYDYRKSKKSGWIKSLKSQGLKPVIEVVETFISEGECLSYEEYWIQQFRSWGFRLLNMAEGGGQGYPAIGENNYNSKLLEKEVIYICEQIMLGKQFKDINIPKLTKSTYSAIRRKISWKHITLGYNFPPINYKKSTPSRKRSIIDLKTNILYSTIKEAAKSTGKTKQSLYHLLSRKNFSRFKYT